MSFRSRLSHRAKLIAILGLTFAVAQVIAIHTVISNHEARLDARFNLEIERDLHSIAAGLAQPVLDGDQQAVSAAVAPLLLRPEIQRAEVTFESGTMHAVVAGALFENIDTTTAISTPILNQTDGAVQTLGQITLRTNTSAATSELAALRSAATVAAALLVLVQMALLWLVARRFSTPFLRLRQAIATLQDTQLKQPIPDQDQPGEIGEAARALEAFRCDALEMQRLRALIDKRTSFERISILRAMEATKDAFVILDAQGKTIFKNDCAAEMFGDLSSGHAIQEVLQRPELLKKWGEAVESGDSYATTTHIRPNATPRSESTMEDDDQILIRIRISPVFEESGLRSGSVLLATDLTAEQRVESRIRRLTEHDSLTGLHNRQKLESQIDVALTQPDPELCLIMLDLDRFKSINDALGHDVGDALLVHVAGQLRSLARNAQLTVRLGGDEFAVLLSGPGAATGGESLADQIVKILQRPQQVGERQLLTGASIGLAVFGKACESAKDAMHMADLALYEAKRRGRRRYVVFQDEMANAITRKTQVESALRDAIREQQIFAVFQQQRDLPGRTLAGFEALARWVHPELGPVSPAEFIPIAEENGTIGQLTFQMMTYAAKAAARWHGQGFRGRISVNISPVLFADDIVELVQDTLLAAACPSEALEIEITEAVFLDQGERALEQIRRLRSAGVTVALDDFGTGYSSLGYLQRFPVDTIKIDRAFVSRMNGSKMTRSIVKAIVEMGHALGMVVTAEGAEDETDVARLVEAGADIVQGFVDGKPMPIEDADQLVTREFPTQPVFGVRA